MQWVIFTQWIKMLVVKPHNWVFIPGTHITEEEN